MPKYRAKDFIDAIPGTGGIITTIAAKLGCNWHTAKRYITDYPTVARAYDNERQKVIDLAESKVIEAMRDDDMLTVRWYLGMQARDRGYMKSSSMDITSQGERIQIVAVGGLDPEEDI